MTRKSFGLIEALTIDAASTIGLLQSIEALYTATRRENRAARLPKSTPWPRFEGLKTSGLRFERKKVRTEPGAKPTPTVIKSRWMQRQIWA